MTPRESEHRSRQQSSPSRTRTYNLRINSPPLYRLSYRGRWGENLERCGHSCKSQWRNCTVGVRHSGNSARGASSGGCWQASKGLEFAEKTSQPAPFLRPDLQSQESGGSPSSAGDLRCSIDHWNLRFVTTWRTRPELRFGRFPVVDPERVAELAQRLDACRVTSALAGKGAPKSAQHRRLHAGRRRHTQNTNRFKATP